MNYLSFTFFILFFGITFLIYAVFPTKYKWTVLLFSSLVFYYVSTNGHLEFILLSSLIIWLDGLIIQKLNDTFKIRKKDLDKENKKKLKKKIKLYKSIALFVGVALNIIILLVLKYYNFFGSTINMIFNVSFKTMNFVQVLGISFYTLEAISYITDVYRGKFEANKNFFKLTLYLTFFLTVVEGPVSRYDQLGPQLIKCKKVNYKDLVFGFQLVIYGLFKKVVIADRVNIFVNSVFNNQNEYGGIIVVFAILLYTLQLYCEFSGVMDVVSGLAKMMGIDLLQNFNRPFFAKSINEFWQRWHISLGSFLRDYIFYPISLSKPFLHFNKFTRKKLNPYYASLVPMSVALFFVWFFNGMWHGVGFKYIVYGLYYYFLMMLALFTKPLFDKICNYLKINRNSNCYKLFQIVRTFVVVNVGMLIFRADSLDVAGKMFISIFNKFNLADFSNILNLDLGLDIKDYLIVLIGVVIIFTVSLLQEKGVKIREKLYSQNFLIKLVITLVSLFVVIIFGAYGENYGVVDMIYANF